MVEYHQLALENGKYFIGCDFGEGIVHYTAIWAN